jgi:lipoprotein-releasing system permease protein
VTTLKSGQRPKKISDWTSVVKRSAGLHEINVVSPVIIGSGLANRGQQVRPITIQGGLTAETEGITKLTDDVVSGVFELKTGCAVIGSKLASRLSLKVGDRLTILSETGDQRSLIVRGIVEAGIPRFDEDTVFVELHEAQNMLGKPGYISSLQLKIKDVFAAKDVAARLRDQTGLDAIPWDRENTQLLTMLASQTLATGVVRGFALVSVALGVASVLSVTVTQKSKEIGILKSMGAGAKQVIASFVILGALIGSIGGVGGGAVTFVVVQLVQKASMAAPKGTLRLSLDFQFSYIYQALVVAVIMAASGAIFPARRAARMDPVEAIRA